MIINVLSVENFRQFYNTQKIEFSNDKVRNITVIHGDNGSGKTALLNAFLWGLYEKIKLPDPNRIVNERIFSEINVNEEVSVSVEIEFNHNNNKYFLIRKHVYRKRTKKDIEGELVNSDVKLSYINEEGKIIFLENPNKSIKQIMPENLNSMFFFHGEYINKLSDPDNSEEIKNGIKNIMGLTILNRSILHLKKVSKEFEKEMKKYGSEDLNNLINKEEEIEKGIEDNNLSYQTEYNNIEALKKEKNEVGEKLKELESVRELQEEREGIENTIEELKLKVLENKKKQKSYISKNSYLIFSKESLIKTHEIIKDKKISGELPSSIKKPFVDNLLETNKCICGRELVEGTDPYEKVKFWREKAGLEGIDGATTILQGIIKDCDNRIDEIIDDIKNFNKEELDYKEKLKKYNERRDEIGEEILEINNIDITELQNKYTELEKGLSSKEQELGVLKFKKKELNRELEEIRNSIEKTKVKEVKGELAQKRFIASKRAYELLEKKYNIYAGKVKQRVQEKVGEIYSKIIHKSYWAEITDDYELKILKKVRDTTIPVGMSTGERQVASLSFIGGLVNIAKEQYETHKEAEYFKGGIYPIVMDSPFGQLDPEHKKEVALGIPKLSDQLIVLATSSQWKGEVENSMKPKVGKIYLLNNYNPKKDKTIDYEYTIITNMEN